LEADEEEDRESEELDALMPPQPRKFLFEALEMDGAQTLFPLTPPLSPLARGEGAFLR
jgi:hypothetical protein